MSGHGEDDDDYESDPEETKLSMKMRRKEASDDENDEEHGLEEEEEDDDLSDRSRVNSCGESDGQGGAAEYDDDDNELGEEEDEVYDEEEIEDEKNIIDERELLELKQSSEGHVEEVEVKERKEKEPSVVPAAGAFYMHDDRFRGTNGGSARHRCAFDEGNLWVPKDDNKWSHDKFEEMNTKERQYDERTKSSRGQSRSYGRGRGSPGGHVRGHNFRFYNENSNQNIAPKTVKGRGPIRYYQALTWSKKEVPPLQNNDFRKPFDRGSYSSSGRTISSAAHVNSYPPMTVASSLNSASLPFYPSETKKNRTLTQKRNDQAPSVNRNIRPSIQESVSTKQSNSLTRRGNYIVDSVCMEKLFEDEPYVDRSIGNSRMLSASMSTNFLESRGQGHDFHLPGSKPFRVSTKNVVGNASLGAQPHSAPLNHDQGQGQLSLPILAQQLGHRPDSVSQRPSPLQSKISLQTLEYGCDDSHLELSQSNSALVGKGKGMAQVDPWSSFLNKNSQLMGSSGAVGGGHHSTPAFFPVMQFGGQHSGGAGVPTVGMAFPGYVSQSQLGLGNSEMSWLPVLTGGAGGLGASYCPPYISFDSSPAGQVPALPTSRENNASAPNNELKSQQRSEIVNEKFSQRHQSRRYSEMDFGG